MATNGKSLDEKLARVQSGDYRPTDFVIADAKDGDMSMGAATPGFIKDEKDQPTDIPRPLSDYRNAMREMTRSGLVDVMLTSVSTGEILRQEGLFDGSPVTLAVRLNDTTDIWAFRGASYRERPARPFRTPRLDRAAAIADLGLYAMTFYNDLENDMANLEAYARFRDEAEQHETRHFLEVFNPAFPISTGDADLGAYVNDAIARCLAGVASRDRPLFLKMAYNGPKALEELASYDPPNLIVGILGGAAGTTRDTLELVSQAERYGARIALFGRKIYFAEDSLAIVRAMRQVVEGDATPEEAVRAYHDHLAKAGIRSARPVEEDVRITEDILKAGAR
jgi:DhnA family fructose-bisphosphate aldolase class Ia